jgi:hypothetical protein
MRSISMDRISEDNCVKSRRFLVAVCGFVGPQFPLT